jgi:choice-of-anchor B domain-containing protein
MTYLDFPWLNDEGGISYYTHQGWLSEDHQFFFLGDELDELLSETSRTTYIWDMRDLDDIKLINGFTEGSASIDHNMFVYRGLLYQANYTSGLSIFDTKKALNGELVRKGSFDIFPADDSTSFNGSWGVFPYFEGGKVVVTSVEEGLFVLKAQAGVRRTPSGVR